MSWGFFFDLRAELDAASFAALQKLTPRDAPLPDGWPGGEDHELAGYFEPPGSCLDDSFKKILAYPVFKRSAVNKATKAGGKVALQVTVVLDRSQMEVGALLGSVLLAIAARGGVGTLRVFNDGTGPDEDGWSMTIGKGGKVVKKPIGKAVKDLWKLREEVGREIYGDEVLG